MPEVRANGIRLHYEEHGAGAANAPAIVEGLSADLEVVLSAIRAPDAARERGRIS